MGPRRHRRWPIGPEIPLILKLTRCVKFGITAGMGTPMRYLLLFLLSLTAKADFQGSIRFSEAERIHHRDSLNVITSTAAQCLNADLARHQSFYKKWGISAFYGSNSEFSRMTPQERRYYLRRLRLPESLVDQMESTSCIGLTLKCLGKGFEAAGELRVWQRIREYTSLNGADGTALQNALQGLGWKILYWNPNVAKNAQWDAEEQRLYPGNPQHIWGNHASFWNQVRTRGKYLYNRVDDFSSLVNFGTSVARIAREVPFFVGTAHGGYHVFPGAYGQIVEGHSTRAITDRLTVQTSPFSPLMKGGGPQGGPYKSGIVAIPPGY